MCGILGVVDTSEVNITLEDFKEILALLKHRGPDAEGISQDQHFIFGHTRLSVIDLSDVSDQPMFDQGAPRITAYLTHFSAKNTWRTRELVDYPGFRLLW